MTPDYAVALLGRLLYLALLLSAPLLAAGLVIGVVVAVVQAVTQVHEASLSFVPKAVATGALLLYLGPWFVQQFNGFTVEMTREMARIGRRAR
jgi:flagellar biosynthetic protein FliQ